MPEQQKNQTTNLFAIVGTRTRRGGYASRVLTSAEYKGKAFARVGEIDAYDDGSQTPIIDGAAYAATWEGKPLALIGSLLSNSETTPSLFNPGYLSPAAEFADARGDTQA
ncbi:hypothetical protein [Paraburkholderia strydomiana]|uniref:hypothetical protein n=1 Tax=Paraburkholderia strydomiana TaxID=1245417 RepID=UPI001BE9C6AA|nr:hypothetical protein [Paraburkholderia strydomiana]MBT2792199.1 hypothetical protein [Paraburkholderia strydomiana]